MRLSSKIGTTLEMIKWEHSVFALPFALTAAMLAASGWPSVFAWSLRDLREWRSTVGQTLNSMQGTLVPRRCARFRQVS